MATALKPIDAVNESSPPLPINLSESSAKWYFVGALGMTAVGIFTMYQLNMNMGREFTTDLIYSITRDIASRIISTVKLNV